MSKKKIAIISGIGGMDGYHLSSLLLLKGYKVIGIYRRTSSSTLWRLANIPHYERHMKNGQLILEAGDVTDLSSIARIVAAYKPDEFYNLAAMSQVWHSFKSPISTAEITGVGALNCLEAVRQFAPECRFYQASSSEMFGNTAIGNRATPLPNGGFEILLNESSPMIPRSPYGAAKLFAHNMVRNYREAYDMFAVGGVLFNHSSCYRGEEFATRKITVNLAKILAGKQESFAMGNLESYRDEGHSADYMTAAWMMLQQNQPKDYVVATGKAHSVKEFIQLAFSYAGIDDWQKYVTTDPSLYRSSEIHMLIGDSSKARQELGWSPTYSFEELVYSMVGTDALRQGVIAKVKRKEEIGI